MRIHPIARFAKMDATGSVDAGKSTSIDNSPMSPRLIAPKGAKSPYWAYFGQEVDASGKKINERCVHCKLCKTILLNPVKPLILNNI